MSTTDIRPDTAEVLPLAEYDLVIVSFSGGKDCTAAFLDLVERGVDLSKVELWHQAIDGEPGSHRPGDFRMDWPCTESYCRAFAKAFGVKIRFQWRQGGFLREMTKRDARSAPISFELSDGTVGTAGGVRGKIATRMMFPQVSPDLRVRWCSSNLKIDVSAAAINNDPRLKRAKVLFVSGERRQESANRARYATMERHRCSTLGRRVDHYRNVIEWTDEDVWDTLRRWRVVCHPAYRLGYGRVSCQKCIFADNDQWATNRFLDPRGFGQVAGFEEAFGKTITRSLTVIQRADRGRNMAADAPAWLAALAMGEQYPSDRIVLPLGEEWVLPAGAFKRCGGPL